MSKKMWNKIFKSSKITRNSKISPAATAIAVKSNKRCSILEEFQQLHAYSGQQAEIQEKPKKLDREQQHQENQTHEVGEQQKQQLPLSKLLQKHIANADGSDANTASEYTLDAGSANSSVTKNSEIVQILANNADGILQKPASDKKVTPQATANANDQLISNRNYSNNSLPTSSNRKQQSTFSKVVSSFTLKRNNKSNGGTQKQQEVQNINENANVKAKSKSPQYNSNTIANTADPYPDAPAKLVPCVICRRTFNPVTLQKHVGICEKMATKKRNVFDSSRQRREGTELASYPLPKNFCLPSLNQEQRGQSPKPLQHIASPTFIRKKSNDSNELTRSTARASVRKLPASRNVKSHSKSPSGTFVPTTIPNNGAAASVDASIALPNNNQMVTSTVSTASFTRDRIRSSDRAQVKRIQQSPAAEQCPHCERCFGPKAYDRHVEWCKEKALQASIKQTSKTEQNLAKERLEARTKYRAPCLKTKRSINRDKYAGLACDEIEFGDSLKTIYGTHSNNSSDSNNTNGSNNNNSNIGQVNRIISNDNSNNINNSFANGIDFHTSLAARKTHGNSGGTNSEEIVKIACFDNIRLTGSHLPAMMKKIPKRRITLNTNKMQPQQQQINEATYLQQATSHALPHFEKAQSLGTYDEKLSTTTTSDHTREQNLGDVNALSATLTYTNFPLRSVTNPRTQSRIKAQPTVNTVTSVSKSRNLVKSNKLPVEKQQNISVDAATVMTDQEGSIERATASDIHNSQVYEAQQRQQHQLQQQLQQQRFQQQKQRCTPGNLATPMQQMLQKHQTSFDKLPNTTIAVTTLETATTSTATASHTKLEVNAIRSLTICRPKRKKLLRQSISAHATPMKAIPLLKESIEQLRDGGSIRADDNMDDEIKVIKAPPKLARDKSFVMSDLPLADKYDPFLSAKRQLEELCLSSPSNKPSFSTKLPNDSPQTLPTSAGFPSKMSTSLTLGTSIPSTSPLTTTNSQNQRNATATQDKTAASSNFRRASSLRGPRRSPLLSSRPLFAQKHRPTIQRGLSDEGPISTNFLKPEEYDEMPVRSVCVNDYALTKSPRVTRRDNSLSNRKQCLKLNMQGIAVTTSSPTTSSTNCAQNTPNHSAMPNVKSNEELNYSTSKYLSKTDSLAAFLNYEKELDKLNGQAAADAIAGVIASNDADERAPLSPAVNLNNPIITKELKDKSNALSKQNSAKSLKAEHSDTTEAAVASEKLDQHDAMKHLPTAVQNTPPKLGISPCERDNGSTQKSQTLRLKSTISLPQATSTPITKSNSGRTLTTPITTANYTQLPAVNLNDLLADSKAPPLSTLLHSSYSGDLKTSSSSSDYIDPKLINKCDNLPVKLNTVRRPKSHNSSYLNFSSSSSECSAKQNCTISQLTKLLPLTRPATAQQLHTHTRQAAKIPSKAMDISPRSSTTVGTQHTPNVQATLCERNISDGRNLLNRKKRLGRNQFLYDASPEANDSCSADDEANRSSLEYYESKYCSSYQQQRQQEPQPHSFVNMNSESGALQTPPIVPTLPIFEDFDFEEFLSSFENDDKQFALLKDCTEFLLNRTATKPRLALPTPSSHYKELYTQHTNNSNNITHHNTNQQQTNGYSNINNHFEFPNQISSQHTHPTLLLTPSRRSHDESRPISEEFAPIYTRCEELKRSNSNNDAYTQSNADDTFPLTRCNDPEHKKREIFISIETEPNEHGRSPISPDTLRNMVGNPQAMVEVEVDDCDNKFCKISDDDEQLSSIRDGGSSKSHAEDMLKMRHCSQYASGTHLPNVQLNNAKNLIQRMQNDFRQMSEEVGANIREAMTGLSSISGGSSSILYEKMWMNGGDGVGTHGTGTYVQSNTSSSKAPPQSSLTTVSSMCGIAPVSGTSGGVSGDACCDSDNVSSLDSYPISIKSSRRDVGAKLSADSAYGSLSRQRSSELSATPHRGAIRNRPSTSTSTVINSAMLIPKITDSQQYQKQKQNQQKQLQQEATQLYKYAPEKARPRHNSGSSSSENSDGSDCDIKCNQQLQQHEQLYDGIAGSNTNNNYISTHYAPAAHHTSNIMGGNRNNNNNNHNIGCNNESPLISPTIAARNFSNTTTHAAAVTPNDLQSTAIANSSVVATTAEQYSSNSSLSSTNASGVLSRSTSIITSMKMSKFCHECGAKFLIEQAKFCMECGVRRVVL
ncbi:serine-rich adhesin for platelets isoform X2 [Eurosta solidaginis]|uniref:serine-rich adhesin for platelets isoform X2 n=1 Tax=Eurosta solidaginis TaxID=178769 RepID=UPI0035312A19